MTRVVVWTLALLALVSLWFLVNTGYSATKTVTFTWEQSAADLPVLKEWRIHYSFTQGGPYSLLATVPYGGTPQSEYIHPTPVSVVPDGGKRLVYFVATAVATSGAESGWSNEVSDLVDFSTTTIPIQFRIVIQGG
ncbi:MAG: hypothetical protein AB1585_03110 [Thermodesulfobacteriota bacterium]